MTTPVLTIVSPDSGSENVSISREILIKMEMPPSEQMDMEALRVTVNDQLAYAGRTAGFVRPAFQGDVYVVNNYISIHIRPRRMFNYEEIVTVSILAQDTTTPTPNRLESTWHFTTRPEYGAQRPQVDNLEYATRCKEPFATKPMLNAFRGVVLGHVATHELFFEEALYYRVKTSDAAAILKDLNIPVDLPYRSNVLGSLGELDAALQQIAVCWEGAMRELHSLGIGPRTRSFLERIWDSTYPMNRVGAAAATVLLAGSLLGDDE